MSHRGDAGAENRFSLKRVLGVPAPLRRDIEKEELCFSVRCSRAQSGPSWHRVFGRVATCSPTNGVRRCRVTGTLKAALDKATAEEKSGLNNHMWATIVDRDGVVCAVAFSGTDRAAQWPEAV